MQSDRAAERENRGNPAGAAKHDIEASDQLNQSQSMVATLPGDVSRTAGQRRPYLLGTKTPLP